MARIYWQCPITAENLQAHAQPGQEFKLHLSAAAQEALSVILGPEGEALYWAARERAARGDLDAQREEVNLRTKARKYLGL